MLSDLEPSNLGTPGREPINAGSKCVLYTAPSADRFRAFMEELGQVASSTPGSSLYAGAQSPCLSWNDMALCWMAEHAPANVLGLLRELYVHLVILDLRAATRTEFEHAVAHGRAILGALDDVDDVEARYGFHRIVALVSGPDPGAVDALLVELGARGVRTVLRQRPGTRDPVDFPRRVVKTAVELILHRPRGARALCAAGGGITGIYYELGALKCLDDCLTPDAAGHFDMYFGISAGAVVASILAAGYSVDELMAAIAGVEGGRMPPLDLRLLRWAHVNHTDLRSRLRQAVSTSMRDLWAMLRGLRHPSLSSLMFDYSEALAPPFHSDRFEMILRSALEATGACNDFRRLQRPLYIGATDQDTRRHVLFGAPGFDHIPISRAVQASFSVNPAFGAVAIEGRYYEDGAVTRTSNFVEAIRNGATLVFVLDPFVPYVSPTPGMARARGMLYNIDQNIRAVSYTRFENARDWVLRRHPEVSTYTFLPSNWLRGILSINPMDHRPYPEIWRGAYLSTLPRIQRLSHRMRGDLAAHGITVNTARAEEVAARLRRVPRPGLADFFPDGRIALRQPGFPAPVPAAGTVTT